METFEAIKNRKSVRSYLDKPVEKDLIEEVAKAGYMAAGTPMAGKVYIHIIANKDLLNELVLTTKAVMTKSNIPMLQSLGSNPGFSPIYGAPVAAIISVDQASDDNTKSMSIQNAACAAENMLIQAVDLGLGSCYLNTPTLAFFNPSFKKKVGLNDNANAVAVVIFGYTNDNSPHKEYPENPEEIKYIF